MKKLGADIMKITRKPVITFWCISHVLNLVAKKILELPYFKETLVYCNNIVHIITTTKKVVKEIYDRTGGSINIRKGCSTRLSSFSQLFNGIIKNKDLLLNIQLPLFKN